MSDTSKKSVDLTPKPLLTMSGHNGAIYGIAYLPSGERLVTCSDDKTVRIWNVENGEPEGTSMEYDGWVKGLAVTKNGKRILSGGMDERLRVWDVETHQLVEEWTDHKKVIRSITMSPDGELVASGHSNGDIFIRETDGGTVKHSFTSGSGDVNSVSFSPNGKKLASGNDDKAIRVFDLESSDLILGPIGGHTQHVYSVVWSLDGSKLFTASWDGTIRCWDSETGEAIGEPWTDHTDDVHCLSLSPDGTKLASGSNDATVRFWATDSGDPIGEPLQHEGAVWAVAFSPSGEFVACGGSSTVISIWRVPRWDDSKEEAHRSFLDLPAVRVPPNAIHHTVIDLDRQLDFLDLPTNRRPSSPRTRLRTSTTEDASRTEGSALSWRRLWTLSRLLFTRSNDWLDMRKDDESTTETPTAPMPTAPGNYALTRWTTSRRLLHPLRTIWGTCGYLAADSSLANAALTQVPLRLPWSSLDVLLQPPILYLLSPRPHIRQRKTC
ncbi:WD40 repeat-like protein [Gyrodon lividus]|nr:WD40 repeat-like protein [Gyrodon lividus]